VAGIFYGSMTNTYSKATISTINYGGWSGEDNSGLVGRINGNIANSFSTATFTCADCPYPSFGTSGYAYGGTLQNLFFNSVSGKPATCIRNLSLGCTEIVNNASYFYSKNNAPLNSWDFTNIWVEQSGNYPILLWETQ